MTACLLSCDPISRGSAHCAGVKLGHDRRRNLDMATKGENTHWLFQNNVPKPPGQAQQPPKPTPTPPSFFNPAPLSQGLCVCV